MTAYIIHNYKPLEIDLEIGFFSIRTLNLDLEDIEWMNTLSRWIEFQIFWEGHKILQNLPLTFDCMYCSQKWGEDWPSQNIWTLKDFIQKCPSMSNNHLVWKRKKGAFESSTHIILFSINQRFAEAQSYGQQVCYSHYLSTRKGFFCNLRSLVCIPERWW